MVNTELNRPFLGGYFYYNILNIVVNTERESGNGASAGNYNILNIVVNTELKEELRFKLTYYNILNIVVNTEPLLTLLV